MQILNFEQGSPEWLKARLGVATASNFAKLITSAGNVSATIDKYALQLATESLLELPEESYKNEAMQRGNDLEPMAREAYEEHNFVKVQEVGFMSCGNYGYSPDGLVGEDGLIEIKCPQATTHTQYLLDDKLPTAYKAQVQGGLYVSGRQWCDFVSFHPNFFVSQRLFVKRVQRDEAFIEQLAILIDMVVEKRDLTLNKLKND